MKSNPLVSIIIPTYNTGSTIRAALQSVLAQTYTHIEIIVVDDGSTDDTVAILQPFLPQITYVHQQNQGVSAARNHGLRLANGELIVFLDADDLLLPEKISKQAPLFADNPKLAIVNSGWQTIDEDGNHLEDVTPWHNAPKLDLRTWLFWKPVFPAAMMFRKKWLDQTTGFDPALTHAEDVDLVFRVMAIGCKAVWLHEITAAYRQRAGSAARQWHLQTEAIIVVLDKFFAQPGLPRRIRRIENSVRYHSLLWYVWQLFIQDPESDAIPDYLRRCREYPDHPDYVILFYWLAQLRSWLPESDLQNSEKFRIAWEHFMKAFDNPKHIPVSGNRSVYAPLLRNWWIGFGHYRQDFQLKLPEFQGFNLVVWRDLLQGAALTDAEFTPPTDPMLRWAAIPVHLTLARRALFSKKPRRFLIEFQRALRASLHLRGRLSRGLLSWWYWLRSTWQYLRGRP